MTEPETTGLGPHEANLVWADCVAAVVGTSPARRRGGKAPPRAAFRANAAGRRAWLDQLGRELKRSECGTHMLIDRDLPAAREGRG